MPTAVAQLFADGHAEALAERGELAKGNPLPQFGSVKVDAVLSEISESDSAASGGVYAMGDFRAAVAKAAFTERPKKATECQVRGEHWKIKDPILSLSATYQFSLTRFLRG